MAKYKTSYASASAAIDWHDLKASGEPLETDNAGMVVVRLSQDSRVAVGVTDPGVSGTAGSPVSKGDACLVMLGAAAANQTIWVMTPADQTQVDVEIDEVAAGPVIAAFA